MAGDVLPDVVTKSTVDSGSVPFLLTVLGSSFPLLYLSPSAQSRIRTEDFFLVREALFTLS
jgi:hypothetical protein